MGGQRSSPVLGGLQSMILYLHLVRILIDGSSLFYTYITPNDYQYPLSMS